MLYRPHLRDQVRHFHEFWRRLSAGEESLTLELFQAWYYVLDKWTRVLVGHRCFNPFLPLMPHERERMADKEAYPMAHNQSGRKIVKIWFWLLLSILTLMVGCASGYYQQKPVYHEEISDYWKSILYHQTSQ
jgi:hypothetical protein